MYQDGVVMEITKEELILSLVFALAGFFLSSRGFILWLNDLTPLYGFLVYYVILYAALLVLSHFGLVIWKFKIAKPLQVFGLLLITFAFFIPIDWESCYINQVVTGTCENVSPIYFGAEDGVTYWFWTAQMHVTDMEQARLLTYVLTPFLLALFGAMLVTEVKLFNN